MSQQHIKLEVDLWLDTNFKDNKDCLDKIAYELISDYLNIRCEEQYRDKEDFENQNGFTIEEYQVNIK